MGSSTTSGSNGSATSASYAITATQRLADSRKKLVRYMLQGETNTPFKSTIEQNQQNVHIGQLHQSNETSSTWNLVKLGFSSWWRHHPANMAVAVAAPLLHRYAERRPFQLLTISAGTGVAMVLLKPWRLVSLGGLTLATLKSSEFSTLVASLLASKNDQYKSEKAQISILKENGY